MKGKLKGKIFNFRNIIISLIIIIMAVTSGISIVQYNSKKLTTNTNKATTNINGNNQSVTINKPKINIAEDNFKYKSKDIITQASKLLGQSYVFGAKNGNAYKNGNANSSLGSVDCSGLIWWTLKSSGVSLPNFGQGNASTVPIDCINWITYGQNGAFFSEVGLWRREDESKNYDFVKDNGYQSVQNTNLGNVNVLKVNDPIGSNYRWYNYYDNAGNKKELPEGVVVISYSRDKKTKKYKNHGWITIGNLGTSNANEAANTLIKRGIIKENQRAYVKSISNSNYWRIESSGGNGVIIDNGNENYEYEETFTDKNGKTITKGFGAIWAFQVAKPDQPMDAQVTIKKVDEKGNSKSGAKFEYIVSNSVPNSNLVNSFFSKSTTCTSSDKVTFYTSKEQLNKGESKYFTIGEFSAPDGCDKYEYYIVIKATNNNGKITYESININGLTETSNNKQFTLNGSTITLKNYNSKSSTMGYDVEIEKIDNSERKISNVSFNVDYLYHDLNTTYNCFDRFISLNKNRKRKYYISRSNT